MQLQPLADALAKISAKTPVGSILKSRDWADVPLALRERAQFSATITSAKLLQAIQDRLQAQIALQRERLADDKAATFDRSSFIDAIRDLAEAEGLAPTDPAKQGTIQDITSIPRLGLIFDIQTQQATGYARWKLDQSPGALIAFPAWRLVRERAAKVPRDWSARWAEAGEAIAWQDALPAPWVALKTSPIWAQLSRFNTPWPPFDFNSGMGVEDVDYDEAVSLGLVKSGELPKPTAEPDFNDQLRASARDLSQPLLNKLARAFGGQISIREDAIYWTSQPSTTLPPPSQLPFSSQAISRAHSHVAALQQINKGFRVQSASGLNVQFSSLLAGHLSRTGDDIRARFLPAAMATVSNPVEVWEYNHRHYFIGRFKKPNGALGFVVVAARKADDRDEVITILPKKDSELDKFRRGKLIYQMRKAVS